MGYERQQCCCYLIILSRNMSFHSFTFCTCFHTFWKYFAHIYVVACFHAIHWKHHLYATQLFLSCWNGQHLFSFKVFSLSLHFIAFVNVFDSLCTITNDVIPCFHEAPCDAWHQQIHLTSLCLLLTSCEKLTNKKRKYVETFKPFKGWSYEVVKKTSTMIISTTNCCLWATYQQ